MNEEKKKLNKKTAAVILIVIGIVATVYIYTTVGESKSYVGQLARIDYMPKSNGPGNDAILIFNNSGTFNYVVINEYKSGLMLELEYKIGNNIKISYQYYTMQDKNVIINYEVL